MRYIVHVYVHFCRDTIQYGCQAAILFQVFHVQSHYTDMAGQISFKVCIRMMLYKIHMPVDLCCSMIKYRHLAAILLQFFSWPEPLHTHGWTDLIQM